MNFRREESMTSVSWSNIVYFKKTAAVLAAFAFCQYQSADQSSISQLDDTYQVKLKSVITMTNVN